MLSDVVRCVMNNCSQFGKTLRKYRKERGMTLEEMAEKLEISAVYLSELERGNKMPKLSTFVDIANRLSLSADYLLSDVISEARDIQINEISEKLSKLSGKNLAIINSVVDNLCEQLENN